MLKARKKNRIIRIPDEKAEEYKKLGYTLTDKTGAVVFQPVDKDAAISALKQELEVLQAENTDLKEKLAEASVYAEKADQRIAELENPEDHKEAKGKGTKKP